MAEPGRSTRSGRVFNPYMVDDAIVIPQLRIGNILMARAQAEAAADDDDNAPFPHTSPSHHSPLATDIPDVPLPPSNDSPSFEFIPFLNASPRGTKRNREETDDSDGLQAAGGVDAETPLDPISRKKRKKADAARERRRVKRGVGDASVVAQKGVNGARVHMATPLNVSSTAFTFTHHTRPVASTSWMGLRDSNIQDAANRDVAEGAPEFKLPEMQAYNLAEILAPELGMRYIDWNGVPAPVVDEDRVVFMLLAGGPRDPNWDKDVADAAAKQIEEAAKKIFGPDVYYNGQYFETVPRRGPFHSKTVGNSMGGGQEEPAPFFHSVLHTLLLANLLATRPFQRLAGFVNGMFRSYAPRLHDYYLTTLDLLHQWNTTLPRVFDRCTSVFAAATINFGPFTVTLPHLDFANLAWGWCAVTALGNFNPDLGGHLILWDLRLVIRFPPGSTIFIPSAILRHSNVSIQPGEKRFSFTQFTAAGIFRFVANGFRTEKSINEKSLPKEARLRRARERAERWTEGLKMYNTWDLAFE